MKKISKMLALFFTTALVLSSGVYAKSTEYEKLEHTYELENSIRSQNQEWLSKERNEARINIQNSLLKKAQDNQANIQELIYNSEITIRAISYVENHKSYLIKKTDCNSTNECNKVFFDTYVKRSDQYYLEK